jgi:hypothetical protein
VLIHPVFVSWVCTYLAIPGRWRTRSRTCCGRLSHSGRSPDFEGVFGGAGGALISVQEPIRTGERRGAVLIHSKLTSTLLYMITAAAPAACAANAFWTKEQLPRDTSMANSPALAVGGS